MSDFGKGFVYNLVLFAKHFERAREYLKVWEEMRKKDPTLFDVGSAYAIWFNGAGDHMFDLEIPPSMESTRIGKFAVKLQEDILRMRQAWEVSAEDFDKIFERVETLARMIDAELGVKTKKAKWS